MIGEDGAVGANSLGGLVGRAVITPPTPEQVQVARRKLVELFGTEGKKYTVVDGDNLHRILVREFGKLDKVRAPSEREARWLIGLMIDLNPGLVDNPHHIEAGQVLQLPKAHQVGVALVRAQSEEWPQALAGGMFGIVGGFLREAINDAEKDGADPAKAARARAEFDAFNTMKPQYEQFAGQLSPNRVVDRGAGIAPQSSSGVGGSNRDVIRNSR